MWDVCVYVPFHRGKIEVRKRVRIYNRTRRIAFSIFNSIINTFYIWKWNYKKKTWMKNFAVFSTAAAAAVIFLFQTTFLIVTCLRFFIIFSLYIITEWKREKKMRKRKTKCGRRVERVAVCVRFECVKAINGLAIVRGGRSIQRHRVETSARKKSFTRNMRYEKLAHNSKIWEKEKNL